MMNPSAAGLLRREVFIAATGVPAQMERTVVYGIARTGDYLIVAMKESQSVPFQGRNDFRLATVFTNQTQRNIWGACTGDRHSILTLWNKSPVLVTVRPCANILAIFLPNGVSPSNDKISHVQCLVF